MRIPLTGVPDAPQEQSSFAPISTTTYDKVGQAGERLGNTVEGVASDLPVRIKVALDQATLAKADAQQSAAYQGFVDSLSDGKNPANNDPSTFAQRWQDAQTTALNNLSQDNGIKSLSIQAQQEYKSQQARWQVMSKMQVGHLATEKALSNGLADTRTNYELGIQIGTPESIAKSKEVVDTAVSTGLMHPEEGKQLLYQLPVRVEKNQVAKLTDGDYMQGRGPIVAEKLLGAQDKDGTFTNFPHLQGEDRQQAMFNAFRAARGLEAQTAQKYSAMRESGQLPDPAAVKKDVELGALSASAAKGLLAPQKNYSPDAFSGIMSDITRADLSHDDTHQKEAAIRSNINASHEFLDAPSISRLNEALKESLNPKSEVNTPVAQAFFKQAEKDHNDGLFLPYEVKTDSKTTPSTLLGGFMGIGSPAKTETTKELVPQSFGSETARQHWQENLPRDTIETERTHYADYLSKMRQFFVDNTKDGKGPSDTQVNDYARELRRPYAAKAVADAFNPQNAQKTQTPPQTKGSRVTQGGVTYEFDGSSWNPVH